MTTPELGAFGCVRTNGIPAHVIRAFTHSPVNHAFVYVGIQTFTYNGVEYRNCPAIVEANPSGAALAPVSKYGQIFWSEAPEAGQGMFVAAAALRLRGTPYSWVDVACIGITKTTGEDVPESIRKRINRKDRLMCSQLVDRSYHMAGIDLFTDGRIEGDVSPGDLYTLILAQQATSHV